MTTLDLTSLHLPSLKWPIKTHTVKFGYKNNLKAECCFFMWGRIFDWLHCHFFKIAHLLFGLLFMTLHANFNGNQMWCDVSDPSWMTWIYCVTDTEFTSNIIFQLGASCFSLCWRTESELMGRQEMERVKSFITVAQEWNWQFVKIRLISTGASWKSSRKTPLCCVFTLSAVQWEYPWDHKYPPALRVGVTDAHIYLSRIPHVQLVYFPFWAPGIRRCSLNGGALTAAAATVSST